MPYKTCIKIKVKNTYNIEKALNDVYSKYGYHIVRNPAHYERHVCFFEGDKWWTVASEDIDELDLSGLQQLAADFSQIFKTVSYIEPFSLPEGRRYMYHLSAAHSAFDEPPYIQDGPTVLQWSSTAFTCDSDEPFVLEFINIGGISQGLEVYVTGDFVEADSVVLEPFYIHSYDYKKRNKNDNLLTYEAERSKIRLKDGALAYFYDFPDFVFPEGINQYSAVLGYKTECISQRSVHLWMKPLGSQHELDSMSIYFLPKTNRGHGVSWHRKDIPDGLKLFPWC